MTPKVVCLWMVLTVSALSAPVGHAQSNDISSILTQQLQQPWRVSEWRTFNTTANPCEDPDTYNFHSDLTVEIRHCSSGEWTTKNEKWTLQAQADGRTHILIGEEVFDIRYRQVGPQHQLKLTSILSDQLDTGEELVLIISE